MGFFLFVFIALTLAFWLCWALTERKADRLGRQMRIVLGENCAYREQIDSMGEAQRLLDEEITLVRREKGFVEQERDAHRRTLNAALKWHDNLGRELLKHKA